MSLFDRIIEFANRSEELILGIAKTYQLAFSDIHNMSGKLYDLSEHYSTDFSSVKNYFVDSLYRFKKGFKNSLDSFLKRTSKQKNKNSDNNLENIVGEDYINKKNIYDTFRNENKQNRYNKNSYVSSMNYLSSKKTSVSKLANILLGKEKNEKGKRIWTWTDRIKYFDKYLSETQHFKEDLEELKRIINLNKHIKKEYSEKLSCLLS